ncbi:MAG: DHH family phosphoesterase [Peptococcaceae bacterium]|nr:DHH family phosphoesterase [Peptococcaceae bacterium]MDH7523782.1 DHH family phosphoesterase [Peptococcaceae bacterium]
MSYEWLLLLLAAAGFAAAGFLTVGKRKKEKFANNVPGLNPEQLGELPVGTALLDSEGKIIRANKRMSVLLGQKELAGKTVFDLFSVSSFPGKPGYDEITVIAYAGRKAFFIKMLEAAGERGKHLLLCEDITEQLRALRIYRETHPAMAFLQLDNLSEIMKTMAEEDKPHLLGALERVLAEWAGNVEGYLRRIGEGRYILFFTEWGFKQAEKTRFAIIDKIREIDFGNELPLTVSIGIGLHEENISELGRLAQSSLDLALDRGGDQIVVRSPQGIKFYGGKSTSIEKRTKVKARVTADTLKDMINQSSQVVIMGHEMADYDSFGAALSLAKASSDLGKKAWVVVDEHNPATDRLLAALPKGALAARFVSASEAGRRMIDKTLLIVVDTHKPSLLPNRGLLQMAGQVAVIDHHRRGEEFIDEARLVYLESYASSTSELVTELLQYLGDQVEIGKAEATALLAGIAVDTKNFMLKTGVRTFEAASYLRGKGADPVAVQNVLNDDLSTVIKKAEVLRNTRVLYGRIALGISEDVYPDAQLMAAKAADAMLNIAGVSASFVIWPFDGGVAVSARSNGEINVQTIMEKLGGGGHLTVAAAQLNDSLTAVKEQLLNLLEEEFHDKYDGK